MKKINLMWIFAFLFILPLLIAWYYTGIGLSPLYFYTIGMFEKRAVLKMNDRPFSQYSSPMDLLSESINRIIEILAWGSEILSSPWKYIFLISTILIIFITIFIYFYKFIRKENKASFLMILFLSLHIILLGASASKYRLIYAFPFYFVMFSHNAITSIDCLKKEKTYKNIVRIFIILLIAIMLFFYLITGITSPSWEKGEYSWSASAAEFIKKDVVKSNIKYQLLIGVLAPKQMVDYSLYNSGLNVSTIYIFKLMNPDIYSELNHMDIDLEKINTLKPNYLIVYDRAYQALFKEKDKNEIFKEYDLVFRPLTTGIIPYTALVFKRKNMQSTELLFQANDSGEIISKDIFSKSVPKVMEVGKVYTVLVQVKNTIGLRTNYSVEVYPKDTSTIYVDNWLQTATLDANSIHMLKFKIVPLRENIGEVPIIVDVYAKSNGVDRSQKVYTFSEFVYIQK